MIHQTTCARRSMNYKQVKDKNTTPATAENQGQMKKKSWQHPEGKIPIVQRLELNSQQKQ